MICCIRGTDEVLSEDGKLEGSKERKSTFESGKRWKSCAGGAVVRACNLLRVSLGSSELYTFPEV
jgi:hypothetical protein